MPEILSIASITCLFIGIGYLLKAIFFIPAGIRNQGMWKIPENTEKRGGEENENDERAYNRHPRERDVFDYRDARDRRSSAQESGRESDRGVNAQEHGVEETGNEERGRRRGFIRVR